METISALRSNTIRIWKHEGFQKYFKNTSWMFAGRIFSLAISFFVGIYIARYLGPTNYGLMNYAISFVGLFAFLASLGIESIIKREIVKNPSDKSSILGTGLVIKIIGAIIAISTSIVTSYFINPDPLVIGIVLLFSITYIFYAFDILGIYFESQAQSKYPVLISIGATTIGAVVKLLVIYMGYGIIWLIATYLLEALIITCGLIFVFKFKGHSFRKMKFRMNIAKQILKDSWPLMLSGFAVNIYMRIDQVMINNYLGSTEVGVYASAVKLSEAWYFIPTLIGASVSPAIINSLKVSEEVFEERLLKLYSLMAAVSILIAIIITFTSDWIIQILFGAAYSSASTVLKIYIWSGLAVFLGVSMGYFLLAKNLTKISFYSTTLGVISNVILNIILIPRFGINGAAVATVISYSVTTLGVVLFREPRKHMLNIIKKPLRKIKWGLRKTKTRNEIKALIKSDKEIRLNIGAALDRYNGWVSTDITTLDITKESEWQYYFNENSIDSILAEHVFEHLTLEDAKKSLININKYLKTGGVFRMAVPDGNHPSTYFIDVVKPNGLGHGSDDHKVLYNIDIAKKLAEETGFILQPIEYFDENGIFHKNSFDKKNGHINRSNENYNGAFKTDNIEFNKLNQTIPDHLKDQFKKYEITYISLFVDFIKK
jgi:O-antigen/teichoic acid export membrane protein/predicted SAM-dependent methyltransferase